MDRRTAQNEARRLVAAGKLALTEHAKVRDPGRGKYPLVRSEIEKCILHGSIVEGPVPDIKIAGAWTMTFSRLTGDSHHTAAIVLRPGIVVIVITAYRHLGRRR